MVDSGASLDLVNPKTIEGHEDSIMKGDPITLSTCNGDTIADKEVRMRVENMRDEINAVLADSPNIISMGKRVVIGGYGFWWPPNSLTAYFIEPHTYRYIPLRIEDYTPQLDGKTFVCDRASAITCSAVRCSAATAPAATVKPTNPTCIFDVPLLQLPPDTTTSSSLSGQPFHLQHRVCRLQPPRRQRMRRMTRLLVSAVPQTEMMLRARRYLRFPSLLPRTATRRNSKEEDNSEDNEDTRRDLKAEAKSLTTFAYA